MEEYDITIYNNDTYSGVVFQIIVNGSPPSLVGASIKMEIRKHRDDEPIITLTNGNGITITDAINCKFQIDEQIFSGDPGSYIYDIQITFASGKIKTYIKGDFIITGDVTQNG